MDKRLNPSIACSVCSCSYHEKNACTLDRIKVEAMPNGSNGKAADESMCGSYKCCR